MESRSLLQPVLRCIAKSSPSTTARISAAAAAAAAPASRRHQSTTSRTKRALKIAPHTSFLGTPTDASSRVVYNPPSSSPSVYHTPFIFLPRSDPRRQANLAQLFRASSDLAPPASSETQLPPELAAPEQKYNVTREQVDEMRRLRAEDPEAWSVTRLAKRYGCAPYFVMMCCKSSAEHRERERARLEAVKARWGPIRAAAREERKKRKALLLKDAL
ncbi:mitochondrial ribosomal protein subunit L20-domain-containing protein [Hypoxylon cercidicola]|nr:mitochondrial ribosomal protein subunit L20-domain-containing protein [Hypoxylon cercidicola]